MRKPPCHIPVLGSFYGVLSISMINVLFCPSRSFGWRENRNEVAIMTGNVLDFYLMVVFR